jgi:hypothetical protein
MECSLTWFFWWNLHNTQSHSGEYYLKNGCVLKSFGAARGGPSGNVEMPTELFESMKQEAASKASE